VKRSCIALLAAAGVAAMAPSPALPESRDRCAQKGSRTVARDDVARIYARGDFLIGCLRRSGRRTQLFRNEDDGFAHRAAWGEVFLEGRFVAWTVTVVDGSVTTRWVATRDLRTRRSGDEVSYDGELQEVALSHTGGLAIVSGGALKVRDGGGARILDRGVDPSTVTVSGSTLTWSSGGQEREALLAGGITCEPHAGFTLAWDDVGRAYDRGTGRALVACAWRRPSRPVLTTAPHDHVKMAGRFVAWHEAGAVGIHDILTGRDVRPAAGAVIDLAVGGDGLVAWLEDDGRLLATRGITPREIASGSGIEPGSLRVRGGVVMWRQDGAERSAPVPG
jgi:hypothetical protein